MRNEYLVTENRILKAQLKIPLRLNNEERVTLAEIAHRLVLLFPTATKAMNRDDGLIICKERLGGLLKYYHRESA